MTLIVCLDDGNGMLFNNRRQSRDAVLCQRILEISAGKRLRMNAYSAKLFENGQYVLSADPVGEAEAEDYVFAENLDIVAALEKTNRVVIYRWNRMYPSDVKFPVESLSAGFQKESVFEFSGKSHDLITEELYLR